MIVLACFVMMLVVAYFSMKEGLVLAFGNLVNVLFAILISFNLWPYLAMQVEGELRGGALDSLEDCLPLLVVFAAAVVGLRFLTVYIVGNQEFGFSDLFNRGGAFIFGLMSGYFASGFLVLVLQTIPWHENFLGFQPEKNGLGARVMPADQVVLKYLLRAHTGSFAPVVPVGWPHQRELFEKYEAIFALHRRCTETRDVKPWAPEPVPDPNEVKPEEPKPKSDGLDKKKEDDKKDKDKDGEKKDSDKKEGDNPMPEEKKKDDGKEEKPKNP